MEAVKETGINGLEPLTNRSASVQKGIEKEKELFFRIFTCKNDNMKKYLDLKLDLVAMLIIQIEKDIVHWHGALHLGLSPIKIREISYQGTVNADTRLTAGNQKQIDYFGEGMRESWRKGAEEQRHIQKWLADNCFGDYYTRGGLNDKEREMVTFCYLLAQGGCEPQLTAHAMGNMGLGNDKNFLIDVVSQCVPYIGYPRCLNALTCINNAAEKLSK